MAQLIVPDFSAGELSPSLYGRVDTNEYRKGLRTARNVFVHPFGGVSNRPGTIFCGPCKDHANPPRLIPFQFRDEDTYIIEMGDQYFRFLRNGYHLVETPAAITDITQASPAVVTATAHGYSDGDEVVLAGMTGMIGLNGRRVIVAASTANTFAITDQVTGDDIDTTNEDAYVSGGEAARIFELATPYAYADIDQVKYVQSGDIITLTHRDYDPRDLSRTGHTSWSLDVISFAPSIDAPSSVTVTPQGTTGSTTYRYRVSAIEDGTFVEGPYTQGSTATGNATLSSTNFNQISWPAVTGAFRYNIYKEENGLWGFLATTENTSINDVGAIAPNFDQAPRETNDPFAAANDDPGVVGFYQQRKVYGGTNNQPDTSFYSVIADFNNFSRAFPSTAEDAFEATMDAQQINDIRHFVTLDDLLVFTSGAEWKINAGNDQAFSIETFKQRLQSDWGASHVKPLIVGRTVLFVQNLSSTVRSFGFTFEVDGYQGSNLNVLSQHLVNGRQLRDWTYSAIPHTIVYACRDDGVMLSLTFNQEQQVIAWTRNDTKGMFHSAETIPNVAAGEDVSYFVVKRFINGNDVAYIERFHTRTWPDIRDNFFVDSGLILDGPHDIEVLDIDAGDGKITITITGHPFLDGEEVDLSDIVWAPNTDEFGDESQPYPQLNNARFIVSDATANTFQLKDLDGVYVDGSDFNSYVGGGVARCAVDRVWGLHHLVGETVRVFGDGNVEAQDEVVGNDGSVVLPRKMSRISIGIPYLSDIELLDVETPQTTIQGTKKRIPSATLRFEKSRGFWMGPTKDNLTQSKWREDELMWDPDDPRTEDRHLVFNSTWGTNGRVFIRQHTNPLTLTAVIPDIGISPSQIRGRN